MGTQTSFNGRSDRPGLLPKWALLPPDAPAVLDDPSPVIVPVVAPEKPESPDHTKEVPPPQSPAQKPIATPVTPTYSWRSARTSLGGAVKARGRGSSFRKA